jgi:hypothetical protein
MTGSERDVLVEERVNRILNDGPAAAAYADYVEAQLRRRLAARVRAVMRVVTRAIAWIAGDCAACAGIGEGLTRGKQ